jgi:hypothetical protein
MITLYDFGNSVCCQKVRITRGGLSGVLGAWTDDRPYIRR